MKTETFKRNGVKITIEYPEVGVDITQAEYEKRLGEVYKAAYKLIHRKEAKRNDA